MESKDGSDTFYWFQGACYINTCLVFVPVLCTVQLTQTFQRDTESLHWSMKKTFCLILQIPPVLCIPVPGH